MIKFLLLGLLAGRPRHGYELKAAFEELFGGTWPLNPGQVYMTLQKLEDEGLVTLRGRRAGAAPRPARCSRSPKTAASSSSAGRPKPSDGPIRIRDEMVRRCSPRWSPTRGTARST